MTTSDKPGAGATVPIDTELHLINPGTPEAEWVLLREHEGIGPIAESTPRPATGDVPRRGEQEWAAEVLEVVGVEFTPDGDLPHVWHLGLTTD